MTKNKFTQHTIKQICNKAIKHHEVLKNTTKNGVRTIHEQEINRAEKIKATYCGTISLPSSPIAVSQHDAEWIAGWLP